MNKEEIYDEFIAPKVQQVIDICKTNGIAMVASFAIPTEAEPDLCCSTTLADGDGKMPEPLRTMHGAIARAVNGGGVMMMTTTDEDGKKTMTAIIP